MRLWDALDQTVQAKPVQVVGHLARGYVVRDFPQQMSPMVSQFAVGKTSGQETKHQKGAEQGLYGCVGEPQSAGSLSINLDRFINPVECVFSKGAILADPLDVQKTSVGLEAEPPQGGQVRQPFADVEVSGVIDRGLGPQGAVLLEVLLDPRMLLVNMQRGNDPLRNHPQPEPPGSLFGDSPVEDQLHVIRPAQV